MAILSDLLELDVNRFSFQVGPHRLRRLGLDFDFLAIEFLHQTAVDFGRVLVCLRRKREALSLETSVDGPVFLSLLADGRPVEHKKLELCFDDLFEAVGVLLVSSGDDLRVLKVNLTHGRVASGFGYPLPILRI